MLLISYFFYLLNVINFIFFTDIPDEDADDRLMFHSNCGSHAAVINNGRTAHRPKYVLKCIMSFHRLKPLLSENCHQNFAMNKKLLLLKAIKCLSIKLK